MNSKSTLALVVLAGVAALWFFKGDAWGPHIGIKPAHPEPPKSTATVTLDGLSPAAINKVEIAFASGDPFVLERAATESGWKLPGNWPLRKLDVEELVETLGKLRSRFQAIPLPEGSDLSQYGLASDQNPLVVKLTANNQLLTLTFGEPKPAAGETAFTRPAYVRVNDAPEVLKLGPDVMPVVRRSADSYRRRTLFPDVERVKIAGAGSPASPFGAPPANEAPAMVALPGEDTVSIRVAAAVPKVWNLDLAPFFTFALVRIGKLPEPAIFAKNGEPVVQLDRLADAWALDAPAHDRADPVRMRAVLAAVADLWVDSFADADSMDMRLLTARHLPVLFDPLAGYAALCRLPVDVRTGLAGAKESVTVKRKSGEPVTIRFGGIAKVVERDETITVPGGPPGSPPRTIPNKVQSAYRFAQLDGNPQVFVVATEKLSDLFASASALADAQIARFAREDVREIAIRPNSRPEIKLTLTKGNPKATKLEEQQDRWFLDAKPNPLLADTTRVNELLDQLSGFRATGPERTIYPADAMPVETRVAITTRDKRPEGDPDGPAREFTLLLGKPDFAKRRLLVQLAGWPRVTLADNALGPDDPDAWVSALLFPNTISELVDRPALAYRNRRLFDAAAELSGVSVAGKFALKRDPDEWKLTSPITSDSDPGKAGQLALRSRD